MSVFDAHMCIDVIAHKTAKIDDGMIWGSKRKISQISRACIKDISAFTHLIDGTDTTTELTRAVSNSWTPGRFYKLELTLNSPQSTH